MTILKFWLKGACTAVKPYFFTCGSQQIVLWVKCLGATIQMKAYTGQFSPVVLSAVLDKAILSFEMG